MNLVPTLVWLWLTVVNSVSLASSIIVAREPFFAISYLDPKSVASAEAAVGINHALLSTKLRGHPRKIRTS